MNLERSCGVVLHPTCLPGPYGIGDLGPAAHTYLEWLARAGARWWQVLPLSPAGPGWSPYAATSTFAGNTALVSPELLIQDGLLEPSDLADMPQLSPFKVEFERVVPCKGSLLQRAFQRFSKKPRPRRSRAPSRRSGKRAPGGSRSTRRSPPSSAAHRGASWHDWPEDLALHRPEPLAAWAGRHRRELLFEEFSQFLFFSQWRALREKARSLGISILGDVPIYVAGDSAEVWANRALFQLDARGRALFVGGRAARLLLRDGSALGQPALRLGRPRGHGVRVVDRAAARDAGARGRGAPRPLPGIRRVLGSAGGTEDGGQRAAGCRVRGAGSSTRSVRRSATFRWSPRTSASSRRT